MIAVIGKMFVNQNQICEILNVACLIHVGLRRSASSRKIGLPLLLMIGVTINGILGNVIRRQKVEPADKIDARPPDHLDAVRMERDGHINRDFRREVILGETGENLLTDSMDSPEPNAAIKLFKDMFVRADVNGDSLLSESELRDWIAKKVEEHLLQSVKETEDAFNVIDNDHDGFISWKDYHTYFLIQHGMDKSLAEKHIEVHDDFDTKVQDTIIQDKYRWVEADTDPKDDRLSKEEFLPFLHPEQSKRMLYNMVRDILNNLDQNEDEKLTGPEFVALPPGEDIWKDMDSQFQTERLKEFNNIDKDKNGFITAHELMLYTDPSNELHAKSEARSLVALADTDNNHLLSLQEILQNQELFLGSKVFNVAQAVHDEF